jgi:hypothetical protein
MGVQELEWDQNNKRYVPKGTAIFTEVSRDLSAIGTRYDHWMELLEEFRSGVVAIDTIRPQYKSKADEVRRERLEATIELIEKQLERRANYDRKVWDMGRQINAIPKITEKRDEKT